MSLVASGKAEETWKGFGFFAHSNAYLDLIPGGLLVYLLFGAFWLSVTLVSHGFAYRILSRHTVSRTQTQFLQHFLDEAAHAYAYFGRSTRFWAGVFLGGIVLPPPGFPVLVGAALILAAFRLIGLKSISKDAAD